MGETVAGPVLAAEIDAGPGVFIVVVLLIIVSIGLFVLLSGSLRRMRSNVQRGTFGASKCGADAVDRPDRDVDHDADRGSGGSEKAERRDRSAVSARADVPPQPKRSDADAD